MLSIAVDDRFEDIMFDLPDETSENIRDDVELENYESMNMGFDFDDFEVV